MKTNSKAIVGIVLLIAIVLVAVGYAAISNITLNISGDVGATPDDANFVVAFTKAETTDAKVTKCEIDNTDELKATMDVSGLTAKDESVSAKFTIENQSADLSAKLTAIPTSSNTTYFDVTYAFSDSTILAGDTQTITVTVTLKQTPVEADVNGTIDVTITAVPEQPPVA